MDKDLVARIQMAAYIYRGQLISDLIYIERHIDEALSRHFCSDPKKRLEIMQVVFGTDRLGFSNKVSMFQFICETHYSDFLKENPKMLSELKSLIEERNIVAHYMLDTSDEAGGAFLNGELRFIKFQNKVTPIIRTQADNDKFHQLIVKNVNVLQSFLLDKLL